MEITKENIEARGWIKNTIDESMGIESWYNTYIRDGKEFNCSLTYWPSNNWGGNWCLHIDNLDYDSIASLSLHSYEQIDELINVLNK